MLLKDKVVIVSGIGPGLGQELAYGAAREGAKIAIAARSTDLLNKLKDEIGKKSEVIAVPCDITKPEECKNLVDETVKKYGKLDGLINSAYRAGDFKEIEDSDFSDWHETMNTNFFGTMNLTMAAVKEMTPNQQGAIVMINSLITKNHYQLKVAMRHQKVLWQLQLKFLQKSLVRKESELTQSIWVGCGVHQLKCM